jgi:hypothetical protein
MVDKSSKVYNIFKKSPVSWLIIINGILLIILRIIYFRSLDHEAAYSVESASLFLLFIAIILLIISIIFCFKKKFKPIMLSITFILIYAFAPIEFMTGYVDFLLISSERQSLINNLNLGKYDEIMKNKHYALYSIYDIEKSINQDPNRFSNWITVYKDSSLQLIEIEAGPYFASQAGGSFFYISDKSKLYDRRVYDFIYLSNSLTFLGNNWYWEYRSLRSDQDH